LRKLSRIDRTSIGSAPPSARVGRQPMLHGKWPRMR
jgi:hypothetical protein